MQKLNYYSLTRKGYKSDKNEDHISVPSKKFKPEMMEKKGYFFVLCDGLGGHSAGEIASKICGRTLFGKYYDDKIHENKSLWLINAINTVNIIIRGIAKDFPEYEGMGTTLLSLLISENIAYINNVGDSRLYLYAHKKFEQITEDQSPAWDDYMNGYLTKDDLIKCKYKNIISEAIGLRDEPTINSYRLELPEKYFFMLCSDGITDECLDDELKQIIDSCSSLQECSMQLYNLAIEKGSIDDISIILVSNYIE